MWDDFSEITKKSELRKQGSQAVCLKNYALEVTGIQKVMHKFCIPRQCKNTLQDMLQMTWC